ncbi:hypothetical protein ACEPAF_195 [Sanghuangporus sanghuang]
MSKSVPGVVARGSAGQVIAYFVVEGTQLSFTSTISPSVQPFTSQDATLKYDNKSDLSSAHNISGSIGTATFSFSFDNGPSITGDLNQPALSSKTSVTGSGTWAAL